MLSTSPSNQVPHSSKLLSLEQLPSITKPRPSQSIFLSNSQTYDLKASLNMQYPPPERESNLSPQKRTSILQSPRPAVAWPATSTELMASPKNAYGFNLEYSQATAKPTVTIGATKPTYNVSLTSVGPNSPLKPRNEPRNSIVDSIVLMETKTLQQGSPLPSNRSSNAQLFLPSGYSARSRVNSEYDVEDPLKQDSTKEVYKRAAKFLLSSSEDSLPGLYRNKSHNTPGSSQLLVGNKDSNPLLQRRHKESADDVTSNQNPLIKVSSTRQPRNQEKDVSEEVVKTLPDSPVHQKQRENSLPKTFNVSVAEPANSSGRGLRTIFKKQIQLISSGDSGASPKVNLVRSRDLLAKRQRGYDLASERKQQYFVGTKPALVENPQTARAGNSLSIEEKSPLLSPRKVMQRSGSETKTQTLPPIAQPKSKPILRRSRVGLTALELGEDAVQTTAQTARRVTFVLKDSLQEIIKPRDDSQGDSSSDESETSK